MIIAHVVKVVPLILKLYDRVVSLGIDRGFGKVALMGKGTIRGVTDTIRARCVAFGAAFATVPLFARAGAGELIFAVGLEHKCALEKSVMAVVDGTGFFRQLGHIRLQSSHLDFPLKRLPAPIQVGDTIVINKRAWVDRVRSFNRSANILKRTFGCFTRRNTNHKLGLFPLSLDAMRKI